MISENLHMKINDIRKLNLDRLIGNPGVHGRIAKFAHENDLDPSYISQLLNGHRNIGEKAAHTLEDKLKLPRGFLDRPLSEDAASEAAEAYAQELGDGAITLLNLYKAASPELRTAALRVLETPLHPYTAKPE